MSDSLESIVGVIQLAVAALLSFYLFQVFSIFPELTTGPFSGVFALLSALPWVFVILTAVVFLTMIVEVFD
jgi:hypothetical protein